MNVAPLIPPAAQAMAEALDLARTDMEDAMLRVGRIAGLNGLSACVAGVLLRVQLQMAGRPE